MTAARVAENPLWYHTIDLPDGSATPGWFDLRPVVDDLPWPDVRGKRCLDVGTYDGFLAFELERRGAAEVVATDISDHAQWDWPPDMRARGPATLAEVAGPQKGLGFEIARDLLGSKARREQISVYDLSPERAGEFDVVVCGTLMLHLATRSRRSRRSAGELCQWWIPSPAGHRQMLFSAGFTVQKATRPYSVRFGPAHPRPRGFSAWRSGLRRALTGAPGVPHVAALAAPRL